MIKTARLGFSPGLASTLVVLLLVPSLLFPANWQWQRFQYKTARQAHLKTSKHLLTIKFANVLQTKEASQDLLSLEGVGVGTQGKLLNTYTILLDHQTLKGQAGYKVLTPLVLDHDHLNLDHLALDHKIGPEDSRFHPPLILIDRGWIPMGAKRETLPTLASIPGTVSVEGRLYLPVKAFKLPKIPIRAFHKHEQAYEAINPRSWPLRVLSIDLKELEQKLGHELYPLILRLEPGDKLGFEIPPFEHQQGTPPSKHLGYALQWFMMALAVLIYYLVINIRKGL